MVLSQRSSLPSGAWKNINNSARDNLMAYAALSVKKSEYTILPNWPIR